MLVSVMNKAHFPVKIDKYIFYPYKEIFINIGGYDPVFKAIRSDKNLRVGKHNNQDYKKRHNLYVGKKFHFIYDEMNQHKGNAYKYAIQALADPIIKFLPQKDTSYYDKPKPGNNCYGLNVRFFNSSRIFEQGKSAVGRHDIFISHGIGDKNYWIGKHIKKFNYTFCPGPIWEKRMRDTGYKGEIFITGYTKLDPILNGEYTKVERKKPYICWLPTHGYSHKNKGRSSYPFFEKYINEIPNDYIVGNGMHPTTKLHTNKKQLPTMQDLVDADVVIADAGSTVYEAWVCGKPVIFPDWICKNDVLNHFKNDPNNLEYQIYSKGIGYHAKDMKHLNKLIEKALINGMKEESKEFIEGIYPTKLRGKAGENAAKALIDISNKLNGE